MPVLRTVSLLGLTGGFLLISPTLRLGVNDGLARFLTELDKYSPYSYVGVGLALIGLFMVSMVRSSAPH
jgi:hypothetical protein